MQNIIGLTYSAICERLHSSLSVSTYNHSAITIIEPLLYGHGISDQFPYKALLTLGVNVNIFHKRSF